MSGVTEAAEHLNRDAQETGAPFELVADEDNNRIVFNLTLTGEPRTLGYINFPKSETDGYTVEAVSEDDSETLEVDSYEEGAGILAMAVLFALL